MKKKQNREIKFRAWDKKYKKLIYNMMIYSWDDGSRTVRRAGNTPGDMEDFILMQNTDLKDSKGKEIYEGDILQFSDKRAWYRNDVFKLWLGGRITNKEIEKLLKNKPFERRVIKIPDFYGWGLSREIQEYWEVIGNIYENKELLNEKTKKIV